MIKESIWFNLICKCYYFPSTQLWYSILSLDICLSALPGPSERNYASYVIWWISRSQGWVLMPSNDKSLLMSHDGIQSSTGVWNLICWFDLDQHSHTECWCLITLMGIRTSPLYALSSAFFLQRDISSLSLYPSSYHAKGWIWLKWISLRELVYI